MMRQAWRQLLSGSVRRQLIIGVALVHAVMMSLFVWDLTVRQKKLLLDEQTSQTRSLAQSLSLSIAGWVVARDLNGLQEIMRAQTQHPGLVFAMALDKKGLVLAHTDRARRGQYVTDLPRTPILMVLHRDTGLVDVVSPALVGKEHVGWVRIGLTQHETSLRLAEITRDGILYALAAIVLGVLIAAYMGTRLTHKLYAIQSAADDVAAGHGTRRAPLQGKDEVAALAGRFNEMLDTLQERGRILQMSQAMAHLGSWEYDLENDRLTWSDEVYRIFGLQPQEFRATYAAFFELLPPEERERVHAAYQDSLAENRDGAEIEHRIVHLQSGALRHVHEKCVHVRNAERRIVRSIGMVHDITDRVEAAQELQRHEAQLRAIIDASPIPSLISDAAQRIAYLNPAFSLLFGYTRADIPLLDDWRRAAYPDPRRRAEAIDYCSVEIQRSPLQPGGEMTVRCKDGTERIVLINAVSLGETHIGNKLVTYFDITEHKRLQQQLLQAQKMESIGQLAGGVAHDFNNLLGAMLGYAELLQVCTRGKTVEAQIPQYLEQILTAGNRAKELIAQMLLFSRAGLEQAGVSAPVTLLAPVLQETLSMLRSSIPSSIEVHSHTTDEALSVRILPVQLQQIVFNLAINARDAIGDYGRIDISLARCTVQVTCDACHQTIEGEFVELAVRDSGHGIPLPIRDKMFDPFFTTKEVGKGSGMGLSVVHGLVHALGGHILVSSLEGAGTTLRILLPVGEATAAVVSVPALPAALPVNLQGLRILLVDDELAMASMLQELLTLHGARVRMFTQPREALCAFEAGMDEVDLLITDETMPGLRGMDLAQAMLRLRPALPIILCTGYSERVNADLAAQHGIAGFMLKPLELEPLLALVQTLGLRKPASH